jgi:hypothetical protein
VHLREIFGLEVSSSYHQWKPHHALEVDVKVLRSDYSYGTRASSDKPMLQFKFKIWVCVQIRSKRRHSEHFYLSSWQREVTGQSKPRICKYQGSDISEGNHRIRNTRATCTSSKPFKLYVQKEAIKI